MTPLPIEAPIRTPTVAGTTWPTTLRTCCSIALRSATELGFFLASAAESAGGTEELLAASAVVATGDVWPGGVAGCSARNQAELSARRQTGRTREWKRQRAPRAEIIWTGTRGPHRSMLVVCATCPVNHCEV